MRTSQLFDRRIASSGAAERAIESRGRGALSAERRRLPNDRVSAAELAD